MSVRQSPELGNTGTSTARRRHHDFDLAHKAPARRRPLTPNRTAILGQAVIGLFLLLAILVAVALIASRSVSSTSTHTAVSASSAAAVKTCQTDYQAALAAVAAYKVETGTAPTTIAQLQPWLNRPLISDGFAITLEPSGGGQLEVTAPGHAPTLGSANCAYAG